MREAGMQPFPAVPWMGLFGPAKMPREVVDHLSRELAAVLQKPEVREQIERQAMDVNYLPANAIGILAREQTDVWRSVTKAAGMTPE
jgi:tripartite-type tricarboxylate transporter receptor subunit TctC